MSTTQTQESVTIKPAKFGSISTGTLRTYDLLSAFASELEWQLRRNGEFFSRPENFVLRDKLNALVGESQDQWTGNDEEPLEDEETAQELIGDLQDELQIHFAPAYAYFGAHLGDGADYGYWLDDIETVKEQVEFVSSKEQEYPDDGFTGEWLHVNDHGNCTLYVREANNTDREVWSLV